MEIVGEKSMKIDENWQKLIKIGNIGKIGENPQIQAKML